MTKAKSAGTPDSFLGLGEARGKVPDQVQLEPIVVLHAVVVGVPGCP